MTNPRALLQRYAYFLSGFVASLFIIGTVYAMATIPAGCATPGDCDEISPAFQSATLEADLIMADDDASNTVTIATPADITADFSLTLPGDDGVDGQKLVTDGNGVLTWETDSTTSVDLSYAQYFLTANKSGVSSTHYDFGTDLTEVINTGSAITYNDDGTWTLQPGIWELVAYVQGSGAANQSNFFGQRVAHRVCD